MSVGTFGKFGYAVETTFGTPVSPPTTWVPLKTEELVTNINQFSPELIAATREKNRYALRGKQETTGDISFDLFTDMGHELIAGAFQPGPFTPGTFTPANTLGSFTVEVDKADIQGYRMQGALVNRLTVHAMAGQEAEVTLNLVAQEVVQGSVEPTPVYPTTDPLNWDQTAVTWAGSGDTDFTDVQFTLDNAVIQQHTLRGAGIFGPKYIEPGPRQVTGKFTKHFSSGADYTRFRANTSAALVLAILTAVPNGYTFTFPRIFLRTWRAPMRVADIIVQEVEWLGVLSNGLGYSVQLVTQ